MGRVERVSRCGSAGLADIHDTLDKPLAGSAEGCGTGGLPVGNAAPVSCTVLPVRSPRGTCPAKTRAAAATGPVLLTRLLGDRSAEVDCCVVLRCHALGLFEGKWVTSGAGLAPLGLRRPSAWTWSESLYQPS